MGTVHRVVPLVQPHVQQFLGTPTCVGNTRLRLWGVGTGSGATAVVRLHIVQLLTAPAVSTTVG